MNRKRMKFIIKRNQKIAFEFCQLFHNCVGLMHGESYMLTRFRYNVIELRLTFESRSPFMSFDGMTFQIYRTAAFKYALRRLRRMCL